jgi:hypothetical protein
VAIESAYIRSEVAALFPDDEVPQPSSLPEGAAAGVMAKRRRIPLPLLILAGFIVGVILIVTVRDARRLPQVALSSGAQDQAPTPTPGAAIEEAVRFLNRHFIVEDSEDGKMEPTALHVTASEITFEYDMVELGKPKRHHIATAKIQDLDPASVKDAGVGNIEVHCKGQLLCESESDDGQGKYNPTGSFMFGVFSSAYVNEAKQYFTSIILISDGATAVPEIQHLPTESEIAAFLRENIPSSGHLGGSDGLNFYNRIFLIEGDDLKVTQNLTDARTGKPGYYVLTIPISQLNTAFNSGADMDVALICDVTVNADCITDNIGHRMPNAIVGRDIPNAKDVVPMSRKQEL